MQHLIIYAFALTVTMVGVAQEVCRQRHKRRIERGREEYTKTRNNYDPNKKS